MGLSQQVTELDAAILVCDLGKVKRAIVDGADINCTKSMFLPPLLHAIQKNDEEIIKTLLDNGAVVHILDKDGKNAIIHAAMGGNTHILNQMYLAGVDIEKCDNKGLNGLAYAISEGKIETAKWMIDHGVESCPTAKGMSVKYDPQTLADINEYIKNKKEFDKLAILIEVSEAESSRIGF